MLMDFDKVRLSYASKKKTVKEAKEAKDIQDPEAENWVSEMECQSNKLIIPSCDKFANRCTIQPKSVDRPYFWHILHEASRRENQSDILYIREDQEKIKNRSRESTIHLPLFTLCFIILPCFTDRARPRVRWRKGRSRKVHILQPSLHLWFWCVAFISFYTDNVDEDRASLHRTSLATMVLVRCFFINFFLSFASLITCDVNPTKEPTVLVAILVRNKAHTLPYFLSFLERQDYAKKRVRLWWVRQT